MPRSTPPAAAGMTLVELLVVVAILGLLAATVLPNLAGADGQREVRNAAAAVSSQLTRGPSLAIEQRRSAGLWLEPLESKPWACIDLYSAVVPPAYRGDTFDAAFGVEPRPNGNGKIVDLLPVPNTSISSLPSLGDFSKPGNLVQFGGGPLFDISSNGGWHATMRTTDGQTTSNTIWPAPPPATHPFVVYRMPMRLGQPLVLGGGAAVDLFWSGIGSDSFGSNPSVAGSSIVLLCDPSGSLAEVCFLPGKTGRGMTNRLQVTSPLFLLVGRVDRCGLPSSPSPSKASPGANWQYPDSFWIGIDPQSGIVKVTEVKPNATSATESQEYIRAGLTAVRL